MELFRLLGTIAIDNQNANSEINKTTGLAEKSESKISKAFKKIGTAVATGTVAASAAIVKLSKDAVASYADYEQLVGGVETLFKDSADTVQKYAQNAYKTAGLSANEYMETVTSFSASLLQSLDNDTAKAAESANLAITDMSDNANKMGTSMEYIQNAYQGFAKQNYTMLDNLKLGYGGTKEEMERLLKDAEKLSGMEFDISSFDDVVQAIHIVQTEMGITGTTAKEASTTIQGSVSSMKSAWHNLLIGMADENQNLDALFGQFVDSVVTVGNNIIPRIQKLLPRIVQGVTQLMKQLAGNLPAIIETLLPSIIQGAVNVVAELVRNIPAMVQSVMTALATSLKSGYDTDIQPVFELLGEIVTEILIPALQLVTDMIGKMVDFAKKHFGFLKDVIQSAIDIISGIIQTFTGLISGDWETFCDGIVKTVEGISSALFKAGKEALGSLLDGFKYIWESISKWVTEKVEWITAKFEAVKTFLQGIKDSIMEAASASAETRASRTTTSTANVKAHASGGILTKPTIFGFTPSTGTYHLGGEAGAEAIAPIDKLQGYVRDAVNDGEQLRVLGEMLSVLDNMSQNIRGMAMQPTIIEINKREFGRAVRNVPAY